MPQIRLEADGGDPQCEQLLLDLLRVGALYVTEHMQAEVLAAVAAQHQHLVLLELRRAAAVARSRPRRKSEKEAKEKVRGIDLPRILNRASCCECEEVSIGRA